MKCALPFPLASIPVHYLVALPLGFLLDQILGDPHSWPHPVRWIGRAVHLLEPPLYRCLPHRLGGTILVLLVTSMTGGIVWALLAASEHAHPLVHLAAATILTYYGLSSRSLAQETNAVLCACNQENWLDARRNLSGLVGRDTQQLGPEDIYRACIESVAENTTDGIIAPLFYAGLFGPVGLWVYKAINTLDSMVGYRSPQYIRFGQAAARIDDLANLIPARLGLMLLTLAALVGRARPGRALALGWRDCRKHPSPNAGWTEATMAGALGVQLGGSSSYQGVICEKPLLGDATEMPTIGKARQAIRLMLLASWLALLMACALAILQMSIRTGMVFDSYL